MGLRPLRLIRICHEIKVNPKRTPKDLYKVLGVSKQQLYKDKKILEKLGFKFTYCSKQKTFLIGQDSLINIYDLTLREGFGVIEVAFREGIWLVDKERLENNTCLLQTERD